MTPYESIIRKIIKKRLKNPADLALLKRKTAEKYKIPFPSNVELLNVYRELTKNKEIKKSQCLENLLRLRKIRSLSGIVIVSVLTKPYPCPGKCLYCPSQKGIPKSYLDGEPAVMRAIANKFNPYSQVQSRIKALRNTGHPTDKIDLRIIGGTWSYYPKHYQDWFIRRCFQAANDFNQRGNSKCKIKNAKSKLKIKNLIDEQKKNEKAKHRITGITIETRPDYINIKEMKRLRWLGVTRVELGVQSVYDDILKINKRGHNVQAVIKAGRLLKDAGFKICFQMMPNLAGANIKRDMEMFKKLFSEPDFRPDYLKIYPTALLKEAPLRKLREKGGYKSYSLKELLKLILEIKKEVPYYCRVQRIIRDFPSTKILDGGVKVSNLRQFAEQQMKKEGWKCRCVRCREVKENYDPKEKIYLLRQDYDASGGKEIFLSFENKNRTKLYSLLRLRIPQRDNVELSRIFPALKNAAIVREIHTYGQLVPISETKIAPQHQGLGKKLLKETEKIAEKEFRLKKIAVIAGIGARNYFRKSGYKLKDTYMVKILIKKSDISISLKL